MKKCENLFGLIHFRTPLHLAVCNGHEAIVKLLLEQKCDVNARDMVSLLDVGESVRKWFNIVFLWFQLKQTPLHWAVEEDYPNLVKLLLKHGADPYAESKTGETPVSIAHQLRFDDLLRLMTTYKHVSMEEQQEATDSLMQEMEKDNLNAFKHSDMDISQDSTSCEEGSSSNLHKNLNNSNHQQQNCKYPLLHLHIELSNSINVHWFFH